MKRLLILGPLFLYALFPLTFSFGKIAILATSAPFFVAVRMLFSGVCLLGLAYKYTQLPQSYAVKKDWKLFLQASLFGIYGTYLPEFWALRYLSVAKSAFIFILAPFFTALFAYIKNLETFSYKKVGGLLLGLVGFIPIILMTSDQEPHSDFFINLPELATIFAVVSYAYSWMFVKELVHHKSYSSLFVNGVSMFFSGILALITSLLIGDISMLTTLTGDVYLSFFYNVLCASFVGMFCYWLYAVLLAYFSPTYLSFFGLIEPFFAAFYGWLFLSELVPWYFFVSLIVVGSGLYLYYQEELRFSSFVSSKKE